MTEGLSREEFEEVANKIFGIWVEAGRPGTPEWGVKAIADIIEAAASSLKQAIASCPTCHFSEQQVNIFGLPFDSKGDFCPDSWHSEGKQAEPPSQPAKCPRCGQPKLYPGMACYGNEHEFHVAESPSPASTNTIEVLYHAARKAELEALRQRDAALLKLEHFKEAKEEWARRIAEKCEERDNKGEWPPTESDMLALMTNEP